MPQKRKHNGKKVTTGKSNWRGWLGTVDLLVITGLVQLFLLKILITHLQNKLS